MIDQSHHNLPHFFSIDSKEIGACGTIEQKIYFPLLVRP